MSVLINVRKAYGTLPVTQHRYIVLSHKKFKATFSTG